MILYYLLVYLFPLHYTQEVPLLFKKTLEYTFKPYSPYHTLELGGSLTNKSKFPIKSDLISIEKELILVTHGLVKFPQQTIVSII